MNFELKLDTTIHWNDASICKPTENGTYITISKSTMISFLPYDIVHDAWNYSADSDTSIRVVFWAPIPIDIEALQEEAWYRNEYQNK